MRNILLIEPNYKAKYPPLGLMKISTHHKLQRDQVTFYKGLNNELQAKQWDRIYIATMFSYHWREVAKTVEFYLGSVRDPKDIHVGGVAATLLEDDSFWRDTGVTVHAGLLDEPNMLDNESMAIDDLVPDYSILEDIEYRYPAADAYFSYATRGCVRKCKFCAVHKIEPQYKPYINQFRQRIDEIDRRFGKRRNILLLDNNVLASDNLPDIINDLKTLGFEKGSMYEPENLLSFYLRQLDDPDTFYRSETIQRRLGELLRDFLDRVDRSPRMTKDVKETLEAQGMELGPELLCPEFVTASARALSGPYDRYRIRRKSRRSVDFNQGIDARFLTNEKCALLSEVCINPMRIAFDDIALRDQYEEKVRISAANGLTKLSNYILFNYNDKPSDFYARLRINIDLNKELGIRIFSFPMKYIPVTDKDRTHIGPNWNRKYLRAVQVILNVTRGIVAAGREFFDVAWGATEEEFTEILLMPEDYITNRSERHSDGSIEVWRTDLANLSPSQLREALEIVFENDFRALHLRTDDPALWDFLSHYVKAGAHAQLALAEVAPTKE